MTNFQKFQNSQESENLQKLFFLLGFGVIRLLRDHVVECCGWVTGVDEDEAGVEDEFQEAYDGGTDSASELEDTASDRRIIGKRESRDEEPEAGVPSRDLTFASERIAPRQKGSTSSSTAENDEEEFIVKAPVTESNFDVYEDSQEDHGVQEEERIIEVAREHSLEAGEEEEVDSLVIIKKALPRDAPEDRRVLVSPAHPMLPILGSESGSVGRSEQTQSDARNFVRADYSGEEGDSDADAEDEYYEDENDEDEDDEEDLANVAGRSGKL